MNHYQYARKGRGGRLGISIFYSSLYLTILVFGITSSRWYGNLLGLLAVALLLNELLNNLIIMKLKHRVSLEISDKSITWSTLFMRDSVPIDSIQEVVVVMAGDLEGVTISDVDGRKRAIPRHCYGTASEVIEALRRSNVKHYLTIHKN